MAPLRAILSPVGRAGSRSGGELALAALAAAACGVAAGAVPAVAAGTFVVVAGAAAWLILRIGLTAGALTVLVAGHAVGGRLYITDLVPERLAVSLDLVTLALFAAVVLRPRRAGSTATALVGAFIALAAVQLFNPLVPSADYGILGFRQIALPAMVVVALRYAPISRTDLRLVLLVALAVWLVNVAFAARQWVAGFTALELAWIEDVGSTYLVGDQIRLLGAMRSNQDFGFLAAVAIPAVVVLGFRAERPRVRLLLLAIAAASVAVLFGSLLRSALVGGLVGATAGLVAASHGSRAGRRRLITAGAVATVLLWVGAGLVPELLLPENRREALERRVTSIFAPGRDFAFQQRQQASWPYALRLIAEHPLGAGPGAAGPLSQARTEEAPLGRVVPDNGYLLIAVQLGIPGVLLFIAMLAALAAELARRAREDDALAAAALGSLTAAVTAMLAGNYWSLVGPSTVLAVLVGLALRPRPDPGPPAPQALVGSPAGRVP